MMSLFDLLCGTIPECLCELCSSNAYNDGYNLECNCVECANEKYGIDDDSVWDGLANLLMAPPVFQNNFDAVSYTHLTLPTKA